MLRSPPRKIRSSGAAIAPLGVVALLACSAPQALPPILACDAGGCVQPPPVAVGGGAGSAADGASGCAAAAGDSSCVQCAKASCCDSYEACSGSAACTNLSTCNAACAGVSACASACASEFPEGSATLALLHTCLSSLCTVCSERGTGDACGGSGSSCTAGLTCNGLWCTKACTASSDCGGLGPAGGNAQGEPNACVVTATNGDVCFPGCSISPSDCASYPGTACFSVMDVDGFVAEVCQSLPDAAAD